MKYVNLTVVILSLFFFSCKKDVVSEKPVVSEKKIPVSFSLNDFIQKVSDVDNGKKAKATARSGSLNGISNIYYAVYSASGSKMSSLNQSSSDANFGTIADSLPIGSYTAIILAADAPLIFTAGTNISEASLTASYLSSTFLLPYPNTFCKKVSFDVSGNGMSVNGNVVLERLMGKLKIDVLDVFAVPGYIKVKIEGESVGYNFNTMTPVQDLTSGLGMWLTQIDTGAPNGLFGSTVMNTTQTFTVTITRHDTVFDQVVETKVIRNVRVYPNKQTTLTGYLNSANGSVKTGFEVAVDQTWGEGPASTF
ncbi:hypothetical protein ACTJJ0_32225 [Chitinophaga sp. 22321]|uniref:Fimbrillin-A associated anchor protein Mfa1 and Mfa2 n=1 Tax=Chitinophaga hostae TaxID=2831022 RepID=A0ABS5IXC4_9BACT|nr:hypothetical protein [Chitinophaga hostae]MBS0027614.1 hypothetical protein [Chitinophaga hostae]